MSVKTLMIFSLHSIVVVGRRKILMPAAVNKRSFLLSRAVYTSSLCWLKYRILFDKTLLSRVLDISLRKSFQKRPIGNITVCNRKSPVFGIYIIARLYAIFFYAVFPAPFFRISSEFLANPDIDGNTTVFIKTSPYNAEQ